MKDKHTFFGRCLCRRCRRVEVYDKYLKWFKRQASKWRRRQGKQEIQNQRICCSVCGYTLEDWELDQGVCDCCQYGVE
jgi:hypothetical protein